jgi:AcrR family transcriptional regulator
MADDAGLAAVTMRRLAQAVRVSAMSLYTYVPGRAELLDAMVDVVLAEAVPSWRPRQHWRTRLTAVASVNLELHRRHPWLLDVATTRPTLGPHELAKYEHELGAVEGIGLDDVEMDAAVTLVLQVVQLSARGLRDAAEVAGGTGRDEASWWAEAGPLLADLAAFDAHPLAARVGTAVGERYGAASSALHAFDFGLARVLDGLGVLIDSRNG